MKLIKFVALAVWGSLGFLVLPSCQTAGVQFVGTENVPYRNDVSWIKSGKATADEIRYCLGDPNVELLSKDSVAPIPLYWEFHWDCSPYSYTELNDPVWEWGEENAAKLEVDSQAGVKDDSLLLVEASREFIIDASGGPEEGETLTKASLKIIFNSQSGLVLYKYYRGPPKPE